MLNLILLRPGILLCSLCLLAFSACVRSGSDQRANETFALALDSLFETVPDFSGVVLVADHGSPVYHKSFGFSNFQTRTPLDTNSVFELASVSKQFTSMVIMMLAERQLLSYEDPIKKFFPELPYEGITIRHLLTHTSGLPDYQAVMDEHWDKTKVANNNDNIEYLIRYKPARRFEPGERYEYSNTGYMLLASVAEKASGKEFIEFCRENIFRPVKMTSTDIRTRADKIKLPNMAWGHLYVNDKKRYIPADSFPQFNYAIWLGNRIGPGRVSSTTLDLLRWDRALYATDILVKRTTLEEAFTSARLNNGSLTNYGFGWSLKSDAAKGRIVFHTGDNPGYKTIICRYIDVDQTLIILCNNAHPDFNRLTQGMEDLLSEKL